MRAEEVAQDLRSPVLEPGPRFAGATTTDTRALSAATDDERATTARPDPGTTGLPRRGYRAGILGVGFMGGVHARAVRTGGGVVTLVAASDVDTARDAADLLGARAVADSAEELIASPDVDVVHVCTPNHLHVELARAALQAGKHVVCEKPLAVDVHGAAELAGLAAAAREADGRVAVVPFAYRFHPMVREARERVRRGAVGTISLVHGSYLQDWLLRDSDDNWRVDPALGGASRAFGDIGSHFCDLLEFTTGHRIVRLVAQSATVYPQRVGADGVTHRVETEDAVTLQYQTDRGALGTAVISQVSAGRKNRLFLEISGTESTLTFDQEQPETLWEGRRDASRLLVRDPETLSAAAARYSRLPAGHPQGYQECFDALVADTAAAIGGAVPDGLPTFDDGLRAARLAAAVGESVRSGGWVEVSR
ncbi:Gfo/Idh/MocA family protein [Cellulosimicrobium arenosum]|uniref:Gfo/Idh/MocA family oxidoreductase n=1 Tax=Cellulosimicrobium arenosum TaxID=2708133 RepID=A0A927PFE8_9MICO|nr:Gfo/Idh/MocA family oxidoreductase [Cellulosimicrobium arenosum]MBD8080161.1 Gfo/Idh/MocA family oxidoreductase [Cellulosimicrobium arenosum]